MPPLFERDGYQLLHFKVVLGITLGMTDTLFQEVSGITSGLDTEMVVERGENFQGRSPA